MPTILRRFEAFFYRPTVGFKVERNVAIMPPVSPKVASNQGYPAYDEIRREFRKDIEDIARHTGLTIDEVTTLKKHLFYGKHRLPSEGGLGWYRARFTADQEIAYAWQLAQRGELAAKQKEWFRKLADHELIERLFMSKGIPYRNPASWIPEKEMWDIYPPGAHDLAPPPSIWGTFPGYADWDDLLFK